MQKASTNDSINLLLQTFTSPITRPYIRQTPIHYANNGLQAHLYQLPRTKLARLLREGSHGNGPGSARSTAITKDPP